MHLGNQEAFKKLELHIPTMLFMCSATSHAHPVTPWMHANNELIVKCSWELIVIKIIQPNRDSFIDEKLKPKHRVVKASVLDFLWSYEDENSQVICIFILTTLLIFCWGDVAVTMTDYEVLTLLFLVAAFFSQLLKCTKQHITCIMAN